MPADGNAGGGRHVGSGVERAVELAARGHWLTGQEVSMDKMFIRALKTEAISGMLGWRDVAAVAEGAALILSDAAIRRVADARGLVESIVAKGIRAYGVNTGVGALCDVVVPPSQLRQLSRNIVMSHAVGVGAPLGP